MFCNPLQKFYPKIAAAPIARALGFVAGFVLTGLVTIGPAVAQPIPLLRDTETERLLRSYEDPILKVAGLDPAAVKMYIVNDPEINSFVAEGQNIFVNSGLFIQLQKPNQLIGVLAHETGHIAGGHLSRGSQAIQKASIPMLLSMVAGIAAMIAGAGDAGMAIMMGGQQVAMGQFMAFSRTQEATADQMGQKYLRETHQSGQGMLDVFEKLADEEAMSSEHIDAYARDHPASRERVAALEELVDASPYKNVQDSPASQHAFDMVKAKMIGYLAEPHSVFTRYPLTDTSRPARYARAMAYFRLPNLKSALTEINSLIAEEPNNPYFYEMLGQIYVEMSRPELGIAPYQKSVDLLPDAPQLRVSLAAAQLATEHPALAKPALDNLKLALIQDNEDPFAWYETAQAYSLLGNEPMADLSTAERYYALGAFPQAAQFATRAQRHLAKGSADWERANDIMAVSGPQARQQRS